MQVNLNDEREAIALQIAREALFNYEVARTDVVNPVNGTAPYSIVIFQGQRVEFHDDEWSNSFERDAGTSKAAAYAQKINDSLLDLAKRSAILSLRTKGPSRG